MVEHKEFHISLEMDVFDKLEIIKEYHGIKNLTEIIRFLINYFSAVRTQLRKIRREFNYSAQEIYKQLLDEIIKFPLSKSIKIQYINYIADADFRSIDGQDDDIQLSNLISKMCLLSEKF